MSEERDDSWDYRWLGECQWELEPPGILGLDSVYCGQPAIAKVFWDDEENQSELVCQEHLDMMMGGDDDTE